MRIRPISLQSLITTTIVLSILFVTIGDRVLPSPLKEASQNTRTRLNGILLSLFPEIKVDHGYNNRRNDQIIEQIEQENWFPINGCTN